MRQTFRTPAIISFSTSSEGQVKPATSDACAVIRKRVSGTLSTFLEQSGGRWGWWGWRCRRWTCGGWQSLGHLQRHSHHAVALRRHREGVCLAKVVHKETASGLGIVGKSNLHLVKLIACDWTFLAFIGLPILAHRVEPWFGFTSPENHEETSQQLALHP